MLDSVIEVNKKYYPQTLLKECKYKIKKKKMKNLINYDLDLSSSDSGSDNLTMDLIINLIKVGLMINLLKVRTVF